MFRPCRDSNPRPLQQGANALPLSYQEQSYTYVLFKLNHTTANGVLTEFYFDNRDSGFLNRRATLSDMILLKSKIQAMTGFLWFI